MSRRAGITHVAVRWCTFGAEGDTWESEPNVYPPSKIEDFKKNAEVELGMLYVRNSILNTMLGKTIRDRVPRYRYIFNVPQLCYDSIAVAVVQEFGKLPGVSYKMEKEAGAERHFAMVESLDGAAAFLLGHVARPDVANGSLRITGGRSSFHDMTKMLPGTFVEYVRPTCLRGVPSFQLRKAIVSLNTCTFNGITGCPNWPIIPPPMPGGEDEHFSLAEMDAIVEHAKLELSQPWAVAPLSHPLCANWAKTPTGPNHCERGWTLKNAFK